MTTFALPCYPCDKDLFQCFHDDAQDQRESTTFYNDFKIAERFGLKAVKDTYKRAYKSWKNSIKYLVELAAVSNHLGWEHHNNKDSELSEFYFECFNTINDEVYACDDEGNNTSRFSQEDINFYWKVMD